MPRFGINPGHAASSSSAGGFPSSFTFSRFLSVHHHLAALEWGSWVMGGQSSARNHLSNLTSGPSSLLLARDLSLVSTDTQASGL